MKKSAFSNINMFNKVMPLKSDIVLLRTFPIQFIETAI